MQLSYDTKALNGFAFGVDAIKSFILTCAAIDRRISVEEAVKLGRLELEIQVRHDSWRKKIKGFIPLLFTDREMGKCRMGTWPGVARHHSQIGSGHHVCSTHQQSALDQGKVDTVLDEDDN